MNSVKQRVVNKARTNTNKRVNKRLAYKVWYHMYHIWGDFRLAVNWDMIDAQFREDMYDEIS